MELWERIFSFLVRIPGSLATDYVDPFVNNADHYHHDEFSVEDKILLRMTTVCRAWKEVLSDLICEYVIIYSRWDLASIVDRFEASKRASEGNGVGIGAWVKRIDFRMHRQDVDLPCADTTAKIIRLLNCVPNLEIYVNSNGRNTFAPGRTHPLIINTLISCCGKSLRRVEWNFSECTSWADLASLLQGTPNLETLRIITIYGQNISLPDNTLITLKHLRYLSLGMPNNTLPYLPHSWDPLLSCFCISKDQLPCIERLDINPFPSDAFFAAHGYKLRILRTNSPDTIPYLPFALDFCPNLHSLVIPPNVEICLPESHPFIERIGIFPLVEYPVVAPGRIYEAQIIAPLEQCLGLIEKMVLPKLRLVKVRNVGSLADVVDHPLLLQFWWRRWNIRGVRFEDKNGKSFEKVVSGTSIYYISLIRIQTLEDRRGRFVGLGPGVDFSLRELLVHCWFRVVIIVIAYIPIFCCLFMCIIKWQRQLCTWCRSLYPILIVSKLSSLGLFLLPSLRITVGLTDDGQTLPHSRQITKKYDPLRCVNKYQYLVAYYLQNSVSYIDK